MSMSSRARRAALTLSVLLPLTALTGVTDPASAAPVCGKKLAFLGALTGDAAALGANMKRGAQLAVDRYNDQHPGCTVSLENYDSQGDPSSAAPLATQIVNDPAILGVIGPGFSGESLATGATFANAGLPTITASATNPTVSKQGWATFHRGITNDNSEGWLIARFLKARPTGARVVLVTDEGDYSRTLIRATRAGLGAHAVATLTVHSGQTNFASTISAIKAKNATAVVYGGYYPEAGLLAKQLFARGFTGGFSGGEGVVDPGYTQVAGAVAVSHTLLAGGFAPPNLNQTFSDVYRATYGKAPGLYTLEANDVTKIFLAGLANGASTRAAMQSWVSGYDANGLTKTFSFTATGELVHPKIWMYKPYKATFVAKYQVS